MSDYLIETRQLTKTYGDQTVVKDVDLHVKRGRIYGLLGRNGAGKTTIMKMILGLTPITSGEVDVFGQNIKGHEKRIYPRIGAIIETPGFYPNLTGTENLEIFAKLRGTPSPNAVKNALEVVGLPYRDKKLFSKYSLGMKQRLGIANAILHDPELLILDEPTNGLDPIGIAEMRDFTLIHDENQYDMLKQLWIIPVSKMGYFFSKFVVVLLYSIVFMLITAVASVLSSTLSGIVTLDLQSILFLFQMCLVIAVLSALAILPIMAIAVTQKGYVLPVCMTLVYIFLGFFITPVNMYLHPISSISAVIASSGKIPGLTFIQEINAFWMMLCIFCWDALSVLLAYFSLSRRK